MYFSFTIIFHFLFFFKKYSINKVGFLLVDGFSTLLHSSFLLLFVFLSAMRRVLTLLSPDGSVLSKRFPCPRDFAEVHDPAPEEGSSSFDKKVEEDRRRASQVEGEPL